MNLSIEEILKKFQVSPGLCSVEEIERVEIFINEYKEYRDMFRKTIGTDPIGLTLESIIDSIDWYKNWHKTKSNKV